MAERYADAAKSPRQLQDSIAQQADAVIAGARRGPGVDILDPGCGHAGRSDFRDHRNRFALQGQQDEPGTGRTFPELGEKAGEVTHIRLARQQDDVHLQRSHPGLNPVQPDLELSNVKAAFWRGEHELLVFPVEPLTFTGFSQWPVADVS